MIKGDKRKVYNNVCDRTIHFADLSKNPAKSGIHANSECINNVTDTRIDFIAPTRKESNNWEGNEENTSIKELFRDRRAGYPEIGAQCHTE